MSDNIELLVIKYGAGILQAEDVLKYVDHQLNLGRWNDVYLEIMDSELKSWHTISALFEKYLKCKGITVPTLEESVRALVQYHVETIAAGQVVPHTQFKKLLRDIDNYDYFSKTKEYVGDDLGIEVMYGWYHEDCCSEAEINNGIFKESKKWLEVYAKH